MKLDKFEFVEPKVPTKDEFIVRLREWFEEHPDAHSIYIRAFVPYWCDGAPCEFGVQCAKINPSWGLGGIDDNMTKAQEEQWYNWEDEKQLSWLGNEYSRTLEIVFGSHFEVIIDRELDVQHATFEVHD